MLVGSILESSEDIVQQQLPLGSDQQSKAFGIVAEFETGFLAEGQQSLHHLALKIGGIGH